MERVGCFLFVFFLALAVSEAIECYSCVTGKDGKGCGDDKFDKNSNKKNCTNLLFFSSVTCMKSKHGDTVARTCGLSSNVGCHEVLGAEFCTCKGDLCNEATVQVVSMATLVFVVVTNFAVRFMLNSN